MIKLLEVVVLLVDLPERGLKAGDSGTVVHIFSQPNVAYEVEFVRDDDEPLELALLPEQIRPADPDELS